MTPDPASGSRAECTCTGVGESLQAAHYADCPARATPDPASGSRAAKFAGLRQELEEEMDGALMGVWAEYPRECERALDAVMKVIERRIGDGEARDCAWCATWEPTADNPCAYCNRGAP